MGQGGFRTDWQVNSRDALTVQGDMYKGYDGERVDVSLYSPPSTEQFDDPHNVVGRKYTGALAPSRSTKTPTFNFKSITTARRS